MIQAIFFERDPRLPFTISASSLISSTVNTNRNTDKAGRNGKEIAYIRGISGPPEGIRTPDHPVSARPTTAGRSATELRGAPYIYYGIALLFIFPSCQGLSEDCSFFCSIRFFIFSLMVVVRWSSKSYFSFKSLPGIFMPVDDIST